VKQDKKMRRFCILYSITLLAFVSTGCNQQRYQPAQWRTIAPDPRASGDSATWGTTLPMTTLPMTTLPMTTLPQSAQSEGLDMGQYPPLTTLPGK
jgi:hypothetical protein